MRKSSWVRLATGFTYCDPADFRLYQLLSARVRVPRGDQHELNTAPLRVRELLVLDAAVIVATRHGCPKRVRGTGLGRWAGSESVSRDLSDGKMECFTDENAAERESGGV